ncbi:hypothetical protein [Nonomuraea coxensis]|uniref:hypothetical protein n=1 Tax=Nonomuraea coxensis TaxID=404386 RepID=UPI00146A47C2|nr:hypothetical protein [Nonomuraea coxensis]
MVGSITTGHLRSGAASQPASGAKVIVASAPCCWTVWVTASLERLPYGEAASASASIMNGFGIVNAGVPSCPRKAIDPSGCACAVRPPVLTVNANDVPAAGAWASGQ